MIGSTVSHYQILNKIGEGGMGVVYLAKDLKLKRQVAIKFLPKDLVADSTARNMFINEAINASALDHQAICTVHEIGESEEGYLYIVMAYYEGETLRQKLDKKKPDLPHILDYAIQIAQGLSKAHGAGIVHRDIKPANVLITTEGQIKILDFGLAKLHGQKQRTEEITSEGTITYMSPEQINGTSVDDRTDIWSLGIVLYEMISGKFPFKGEYEQAIIYSVLNEEPEPLQSIMPDIPSELNLIITKALSKDPNKRFQHMIEMRKELERILGNVSRQPETPVYRHSKKTFLAIVFAVLVVLTIWFLWPTQKSERAVLILPLQDLNPSDSMTYFSDGMSEDIITQCSKISGLRVFSRKASMFYKNTETTLQTIQNETGASHILQGTVRRDKGEIRTSIQLREISSGEIIWAETYQRAMGDIFIIQQDIALQIAQALEVSLNLRDQERFKETLNVQLAVYDRYSKGRAYYYRYEKPDMFKAIELFRDALYSDPDFALAHAGLADAFSQLTLRFGESPAYLDSALKHCQFALALNPGLAEAYKALGVIYYTRGHFQKAVGANLKALNANPNHAPAMGNLGWTYLNTGDLPSAFHWLQEASRRSPVNPTISFGLGLLYLHLNELQKAWEWFETTQALQYNHKPHPVIGQIMIHLLDERRAEALDIFNRNIEVVGNDPGLWIAGADAYLISGVPAEAIENYQSALELDVSAWHPLTGINATTSLGFILWKIGKQNEAEQMFELSQKLNNDMIEMQNEWWGNAYDMAAIAAIKGEEETSISWLEKAVKRGFTLSNWLQHDPLFENMRQNQAFLRILNDLTMLTEYSRDKIDSGLSR